MSCPTRTLQNLQLPRIQGDENKMPPTKKDSSEIIYYPVFLNVKGRKCTVIGGGQVALRKVITLLEDGAKVKVISPELCPELASLASRKEIRDHESDHLRGYDARRVAGGAASGSRLDNRLVAAE